LQFQLGLLGQSLLVLDYLLVKSQLATVILGYVVILLVQIFQLEIQARTDAVHVELGLRAHLVGHVMTAKVTGQMPQ
jgi:hypothetical protein